MHMSPGSLSEDWHLTEVCDQGFCLSVMTDVTKGLGLGLRVQGLGFRA